jgi:hypothetical protein
MENNTYKLASLAAFLTVITTFCVHVLFAAGPTDFEARILLFKDLMYIMQRWVIILHGLLVFVTMWGLFLHTYRKSLVWSVPGLIFYTGFIMVELGRMMFILYYLNGLRERYLTETMATTKEMLAHDINQFTLISFSLFGLFMLFIALGNFCFGAAMLKVEGWGRKLGVLLLIWSVLNIIALFNLSYQNQVISKLIEFTNLYFQMGIRLSIGLYLWHLVKINKISNVIY